MPLDPSAAPPAADFGSRFSAFMVDATILFVAQWVVVIVVSRQLQAAGLTSTEPCVDGAVRLCQGPSTPLWALLFVLLLGSTIGYHAFFEHRYGATPGKRWIGLVVVNEDATLPIGMATAVLRSGIRQGFWLSLFFVFDASPLGLGLPSALFVLLPVAGLVVLAPVAFSIDGKGVHDRVSRTRVVRLEDLGTAPATPSSSYDKAVGRVDPTDRKDTTLHATREESHDH